MNKRIQRFISYHLIPVPQILPVTRSLQTLPIRLMDRTTLYLFLLEFVDELSQSHFWDDIVAFNDWRDNHYEIVGEKVIDHFQTWPKEEIARHLFQGVLQKRTSTSPVLQRTKKSFEAKGSR